MQLFVDSDINDQAKAVLAYLSSRNIESSWSNDSRKYMAQPSVAPWYNGRERGYVVYMNDPGINRQINIAFFEHRNSDDICAVQFDGVTFNPPTLADLPPGHPYHDSKWAVSHTVKYGRPAEMAEWIVERLEEFWGRN